jgi:hypothetical protein
MLLLPRRGAHRREINIIVKIMLTKRSPRIEMVPADLLARDPWGCCFGERVKYACARLKTVLRIPS